MLGWDPMSRAGRVASAWTILLLIATFVSSTHGQDGRPARVYLTRMRQALLDNYDGRAHRHQSFAARPPLAARTD
jgi:hypothetical protein